MKYEDPDFRNIPRHAIVVREDRSQFRNDVGPVGNFRPTLKFDLPVYIL